MDHEARAAERLHEALEGLRHHGAARTGPDAGLDEMLQAAERLSGAGEAMAGGPRPAFVLGLEEQLRTDLRLGQAGQPAARHRPWTWPALGAVAVGLTALLWGVLAGPGQISRPLRASLDAARVAVAMTATGQAAVRLDLAWRDLTELRRLVAAGPADAARVADLVAALEGHYAEGLRLAAAAGDERLSRRAAREAGDAAEALRTLAPGAGPAAPALAAGEATLAVMIRRAGPVFGPALPALPVPGATATARAVVVVPPLPATPTEEIGSAATQTGLPPSAPPPTATVEAPLVTAIVPATAVPSTAAPSLTPTTMPTDVPPERPHRQRSPTPVPSATEPRPTRTAPPNATSTPVPTDSWPLTSTPVPSPAVPSPTGPPSGGP